MKRWLLMLLLGAALTACEDESTKPYLKFVGGGFVYNYRIGEAFYGFVAAPERTLPEDAVIEARFENPAGGDPIVERQRARTGQLQYAFKTPPLKGIEAGRDYKVELRVINAQTGEAYATYAKTFHTDIDQSDMPSKPLVVGPGYAKNPQVQ